MNVKENILKKIIRVDQAGELGAQQIYQGQKMIFKLQKKIKKILTKYQKWLQMKKNI